MASTIDIDRRRRIQDNLPKHIHNAVQAALECAATNGVDDQTAIMALGPIRKSLMECAADIGLYSSPGPDVMKETPVRNKLRRKLEAKRAKAKPQVELAFSSRYFLVTQNCVLK